MGFNNIKIQQRKTDNQIINSITNKLRYLGRNKPWLVDYIYNRITWFGFSHIPRSVIIKDERHIIMFCKEFDNQKLSQNTINH